MMALDRYYDNNNWVYTKNNNTVVRGNFSSSWAEDVANKDSGSGSSSAGNQKQQLPQTEKLEEKIPLLPLKFLFLLKKGWTIS